MSRRTAFHLVAAAGVAAAAIALAVAVANPASARPGYGATCNTSGCHTATPVGSVAAVPSTTTPTAGQAYTVNVTVGLSSSGQSGFRISSGASGTPAVTVTGGPGTSPFVANMTAPKAAGTYTYRVWGAKGAPGSGQSTSTTYQITVTGGGIVDTTAPTVLAPSASTVVKGKKATLKYQVNDAAPNLGTASAVITIKNRAGKVVKTLKPGAVAVNATQKTTFVCKLAKGKYTFTVTATDAAGNPSSNSAKNKLTVK